MTPIPVAPSHIHSLIECPWEPDGERVWWRCGFAPPVTNAATALGVSTDDVDLAELERNEAMHDRFPHAALQDAEADAEVGR